MDINFQITGLEETLDMLEEASRETMNGLQPALAAGANVIAAALEEATPTKVRTTGDRSDSLPLGALRESVTVDIEVGSRGGEAEIGFGENGQVAYWLEYGHTLRGHDIRPHPFMRRVADSAADAAVEAFAESLAKTLGQP